MAETDPAPEKSELLYQLRIDRDTPKRGGASRWWLALLVLLAVAGVLAYRTWQAGTRDFLVRTAVAGPVQFDTKSTAVLEATGYVTARRQATVSAKITGRVAQIFIEEGMRVKQGQVLARLDPSDAQAALDLATAQLGAQKSQLTDLNVQLQQAQRDLKRQQDLLPRKLTSEQAEEDAATQVRSLQAKIDVQRKEIEVAQRSVEVAKVGVDNTIIRAPFPGVITDKAAQPGEIVSPVSAGGGFTRTGIGTIVDMDSLEIQVDVNESYISRVQPGQPVTATLDAYPDWKIPAKVIAIIPAADRSKATVKVRIGFDVKDPRIVPDMGVRVSFLEDKAPVAKSRTLPGVLVPATAIRNKGDASAVFIVKNGHARERKVTLGQSFGDARQVLSGLDRGDQVIVAAPAALRDGDPVRIE